MPSVSGNVGAVFNGGTISGSGVSVAPSTGTGFLEVVGPTGGTGAQLTAYDNDTGNGWQFNSPETLPQFAGLLQDSTGVIVLFVTPAGALGTAANAAPSSTDLIAGRAAIWFDSTTGAAKLMVKAKNAAGSVVTGSIPLA